MPKQNISWKDKKILQELDNNARQPFSKIAKNMGFSKQTVVYHVNNLLKNKVIKSFISYIDIQRLGYTFYDLFFKIKYTSQEEEQRIIDEVKKMPEVGWFITTRGEWRFVICIMAKNPMEFKDILDKILNILSYKSVEYDFFIVLEAIQLPYREVYYDESHKQSKLSKLGRTEEIKLNQLDLGILSILSQDARITLTNLAKRLDSNIDKVRHSIKKLEKSGIIQAYKPLIDVSKFGYSWHLMLIQFKYCQDKEKKEFIEFLKSLPEVFYIVQGVGNWSLMVEFHIKELDDLNRVHNKIASKFEDIIQDERIIQVMKEHKCTFYPENL
jgi:DNA-binding Lrp family transcriptional regulator